MTTEDRFQAASEVLSLYRPVPPLMLAGSTPTNVSSSALPSAGAAHVTD